MGQLSLEINLPTTTLKLGSRDYPINPTRNDLRPFLGLRKHSCAEDFLDSYFQRHVLLIVFSSILNKFDFPSTNYPSTLKEKTSGKK